MNKIGKAFISEPSESELLPSLSSFIKPLADRRELFAILILSGYRSHEQGMKLTSKQAAKLALSDADELIVALVKRGET